MRLTQILRSFVKAPRFALSVVLTLGLGLTAALLMWSVLWQAVLQPLPFGAPGELFVLSAQRDGQSSALSSAEAEQLGGFLPEGSTLASFFWNGTTYLGGERPQVLTTLTVSANFLQVLNVKPILGRDLRADDAESNNILISESTWRRYFSADPNVIGKQFMEEGGHSTIVGVVPSSLSFPARDLGYYKAIDWQAMRENQQNYREGRFLNGVLRVRARAAGVAARSAGSGHLSSMYSRMIVESKTRTSPSTSVGISARGLASTKSPPAVPSAMPSGRIGVNGMPFSRSAIFTFMAYVDSGC